MKEARKTTLKSLGYTESALRDLESKAVQVMKAQDAEFIKTEFGDVQLVSRNIYLMKERKVIDQTHKLNLVTI